MRLARGTIAIGVAFMALAAHGTAAAQDSAEFDRLVEIWQETPQDSEEEDIAEARIRTWVEGFLGRETVDAYLAYMDAPLGSDEETQARARAEAGFQEAQVRWDRGADMAWWWRTLDEVEPVEPTDTADADVRKVVGSHEVSLELAATELANTPSNWELEGHIVNHASTPVYIHRGVRLDMATALVRPLGIGNDVLGEFKRDLPREVTFGDDDVWFELRPNRSYRVEWALEGSVEDTGQSGFAWWRRYLWPPASGDYRFEVFAVVANGNPKETDPVPFADTEDMSYGPHVASRLPAALIGAAIGLLLQALSGAAGAKARSWLLSFAGAGVLVSVVLLLNDSLIPLQVGYVNIQNATAALATGIVVQLLGYDHFMKLLEKVVGRDSGSSDPKDAPIDDDAGDVENA